MSALEIKHLSGNKPREFLVHEWVGRASLTIIAGSPESGKSTALRTLAVALANGEPDWLGFQLGYFEDAYAAPRASVIGLFLEESEQEVQRHLVEIGLEGNSDLFLLSLEGNEDPLLALDQAMAQHCPQLVIIDTMGEFLGVRDVNSYGESVEKLQALRELSNRHKSAIICTHHTPKHQTSAENALLGSTGIRATVDSAAVIRALPRTRTRILEPSKVRVGSRFEAIAVGRDETGRSYKIGPATEAQARESVEWFAELIQAEGAPLSRGDLAQLTGLPFPEVASALFLDPDRKLERARVGKTSVKYSLRVPSFSEQEKTSSWQETL